MRTRAALVRVADTIRNKVSTTNDDQAMVTINNVGKVEGNAGNTNLTFTINLSAVVDAPVSFSAGTVDGSAFSFLSTGGSFIAAGVAAALIGLAVPGLRILYDYSWFAGFGVAFALYWLLMRGTPVIDLSVVPDANAREDQ